MQVELDALRQSAERLRRIVEPLDASTLGTRAYTPDWTIAQVLSHLGSMAAIMRRQLDDSLSERSAPDTQRQIVWDEWNAKAPQAQADDALAEDEELLRRLESLTAEERSRFNFAVGPLTVDIREFAGLRVGEHALHTWDVEVTLDRSAIVPGELAGVVVDHFGLLAPLIAKPTGTTRRMVVRSTDPGRQFSVDLTPERVGLNPTNDAGEPDLQMPTEALARLFYGRLDEAHTPDFRGDEAVLDELRRAFPGF